MVRASHSDTEDVVEDETLQVPEGAFGVPRLPLHPDLTNGWFGMACEENDRPPNIS